MNGTNDPPGLSGGGGFGDDSASLREAAAARLAAIIESSDDAIVSKTLDGIILTWNAGAERIFGYTAAQVVGKPITIIIPPDRLSEEPAILARLRRGERMDHFETVRLTKDGRLIDVSVTISPVRDAHGHVIGVSKIARDITEQKQIQRELKLAKEAAEAGSRAKDHFLSVLSHELRTPLTPVLASLGLLESRGDVPPELRDELNMIRRNVETEARLVDDLLDLTRISRGKLDLHFEAVDVHAAVEYAAGMFRGAIATKAITLETSMHAREHKVWADPVRLEQIFLNLLSNAVKFTPQGGRISIRSEDVAGDVRVEIRDNGSGIEPEAMGRLFTAFEQGERTTTRRFGGLGLGLSIARSLVEMHGGRIAAHSAGANLGATLTVTLKTVPASRATSSPPPLMSSATAISCRVLLVEDHEDTRRVLSRLLTTFGCTVFTAGSVAEALKLSDAQDFDLLISDIGLPDGSGADIMRQLKKRGGDIKGVAISGFGQPEDHTRSREAGFNTHLTKPVNFNTLADVIRKMAG
jgi:PAS domain S-box-containing protein